jgi:hypothetical protein
MLNIERLLSPMQADMGSLLAACHDFDLYSVYPRNASVYFIHHTIEKRISGERRRNKIGDWRLFDMVLSGCRWGHHSED